jgi:hypothetical protein
MATLHELNTVYGQQDLHNMAEVVMVDSYNKYLANKSANKE